MKDAVEHRVLKLEWRADQNEKDCHELHDEHRELRKELRALTKTLFQIKWLIIGAVAAIVTKEFGLSELIGMLL